MTNTEQTPTEQTDADTFEALMAETTQPAEAAPAAPVEEFEEIPPESEQTTTEADGQNAGQEGSADPEWMQAMPEEAQTAWKELVESNRKLAADFSQERQARLAVEGRIRPVQQKLARLESQTRPGGAATPTPATQASPASQLDSFYDSPSWKKFEGEFPEEAATQRKAMEWNAQRSEERIRQLEEKFVHDPRLEQLTQFHEEQRLGQAKKSLSEVHPDWEEINQSPEFMEWLGDWRQNQPEDTHDIYMDEGRFRRMCSDPKFASSLLTQYKRDLYLADLYLAQQGNAAPAPPTKPAASALLGLTAAPSIRGTSAPRRTGPSTSSDAETFDKLFNS